MIQADQVVETGLIEGCLRARLWIGKALGIKIECLQPEVVATVAQEVGIRFAEDSVQEEDKFSGGIEASC